MATWMSHFRIADYLLDRLPGLDAPAFVVGNIGPDCGVPNADWSVFTPSGDVTHWRNPALGNDIDHEGFRVAWLTGAASVGDAAEAAPSVSQRAWSFYLGYYIHLLSDVWWGALVHQPKTRLFQAEMASDPRFIWVMKKDWYDLDFAFLQGQRNFRPFRIFQQVGEFGNDLLDYYPAGAFTRQIKYISDFYTQSKDLAGREYVYLNRSEIDGYCARACTEIEQVLGDKGFMPRRLRCVIF